MYRGFAAGLALVFALPAAACGGLESGVGSGASTGSANVSGLSGSAGTVADSGASVGSGTSAVAPSGASGPSSGANTSITSGSSGTAATGPVLGSGANPNSESSSGMAYAPCGAGASTATVSFANQIMPIFQSNCSVGGGTGPATLCHGDPSAAMPFAPGGARQWFGPPAPAVNSAATLTMIYNGFVNQPSTEDLSMDVIKPGDPTQSFLWYKINNTQDSLDAETPDQCLRGDLGTCGSAMPLPLTGATVTFLPQADLDLVCNWIVQGASAGGTLTTPPTASLVCTTTEAPNGACSCEQAIEGRDYMLTCTTTNGTVSCTCVVDGAVTFDWNPHPQGYSDPTFCASASSISTFFTAPGTAPVTGCNFP
jgi:hypothetical protein